MAYSSSTVEIVGTEDFNPIGIFGATFHTITCTGSSAEVLYKQDDSEFISAQTVTNGSININAYGVSAIRVVSSGTTSVTIGGK